MSSLKPTTSPQFCPSCGKALRIERQPNYRRIDGKLTEVEPLYLATCDNDECCFCGFTVVTSTFSNPVELRRYGLEYAPYDVRTGAYKPAWVRFSNCGPDTTEDKAWKRLLKSKGCLVIGGAS